MTAGAGRNIIADRCDMMIEVRGDTEAALAYMEARAEEVLAGAAAMHGCSFETQVMGRSAGIVQSPEAVAQVAAVAGRIAGVDEVLPGWSIGGGDDATFMMRRVQEHGGKAAYFLIGSDIANVHHAIDFDIDEASLECGVRLFVGLADSILGAKS